MLSGYFDYIFVHRKKKKKTLRLRPELSPKFLSSLVQTRLEKPSPIYNSDVRCLQVYGAIIVWAVFYPKNNSINLLYCRALIYGTVLSTIMRN